MLCSLFPIITHNKRVNSVLTFLPLHECWYLSEVYGLFILYLFLLPLLLLPFLLLLTLPQPSPPSCPLFFLLFLSSSHTLLSFYYSGLYVLLGFCFRR